MLSSFGNVVDAYICGVVSKYLSGENKLHPSSTQDVFYALSAIGALPWLRGLQKAVLAAAEAHCFISLAWRRRDNAVVKIQNRFRVRRQLKMSRAANVLQKAVITWIIAKRSKGRL